MPLVRASLPARATPAQMRQISDAIHESLVATFQVPAEDRFQVLTRHEDDALVCTPRYLGIVHEGPVAFVQITCSEGRPLEVKRALYQRLASAIAAGGYIAAGNVIVNLVETRRENWSFGNGLAHYALP